VTDEGSLRLIRAENASPMTLDGTRTFIVGERAPLVIDPGPADAAHLAAIEAALDGATPVAILLTHDHPDHAAAAPALSERLGAPIRAGGAAQGILALRDGEELRSDAGSIRAVATPGHTPDHISFWWTGGNAPARGALFVGDLLMGEGDTTLVAPPEGDLAAYLRSLDRVDELAPAVLYPAHGPPLTDPAAAVSRYREHRRERIRQVTDARRASPHASPEELVDLVYGRALHPGLRGAAEGSIRAILELLRSGEAP
jgi:glyoxylase-like metal-dependent hydrolase (beta-lactamase superfamily II)